MRAARRSASPASPAALRRRGERLGHGYKLHVTDAARPYVPPEQFSARVAVLRAAGEVIEPLAEPAAEAPATQAAPEAPAAESAPDTAETPAAEPAADADAPAAEKTENADAKNEA